MTAIKIDQITISLSKELNFKGLKSFLRFFICLITCIITLASPASAQQNCGVVRSVDQRDAPPSRPIDNLPGRLLKISDLASAPKGGSFDTYLGQGFMNSYRSREGTETHAQGITVTGDGRVVFNYSLRRPGGAPIIWTDQIFGSKGREIKSQFMTLFDRYHPSAMQAAGNIVAMTDNDDDAGKGDVRFFHLDGNDTWTELTHMKMENKKYNGVGFVRHMDGYYYLIGEFSPIFNAGSTRVEVWKSSSSSGIFCPQDQMVSFDVPIIIPFPTSASNTHLVSKSMSEIWIVALYSPDGDASEYVSVSLLDLDQGVIRPVLPVWKLGQFWHGTVKTLRPSARWAAGISVVNGVPMLIYGHRSVLGLNSKYYFGFVLLSE